MASVLRMQPFMPLLIFNAVSAHENQFLKYAQDDFEDQNTRSLLPCQRRRCMGQPDLRAKRFFGNHNDTFADVFNGFIFTDEDTRLTAVDARLKSEPTEGIIEDLDGNARDLLRDLVKSYSDRDHKSKLAILSLENETDIRREIPIKVMGYIYSLYRDQLREYKNTRASLIKEKKTARKSGDKTAEDAAVSRLRELGNFVLTPVVVIVLNFGKPKKDIARSLYELMDKDNPYSTHGSDFKIRVYDLKGMSSTQRARFTGDFRIFIDMLNEAELSEALSDQVIAYPDDFIAMINSHGIPCDIKPTEKGGNLKVRTVFTDLVKDLKRAKTEASKARAEARSAQAQAESARAQAESAQAQAESAESRAYDNIAGRMLKDNVPLNKIIEFTNLSKEHILSLAQSIGVTPV